MKSVLVPLVAHRWIADLDRLAYECRPGIPSLRRKEDPSCYGCKSRIPFSLIPGLRRFDGCSARPDLAHALALRLDLRFQELRLEAPRQPVKEAARAS